MARAPLFQGTKALFSCASGPRPEWNVCPFKKGVQKSCALAYTCRECIASLCRTAGEPAVPRSTGKAFQPSGLCRHCAAVRDPRTPSARPSGDSAKVARMPGFWIPASRISPIAASGRRFLFRVSRMDSPPAPVAFHDFAWQAPSAAPCLAPSE